MTNWSFKDISDWGNAIFGIPDDVTVLVHRADKEFDELWGTLYVNDCGQIYTPTAKIAEEITDIVIVLAQACAFIGHDLQEEINKKMAINSVRTWATTAKGVGQHV